MTKRIMVLIAAAFFSTLMVIACATEKCAKKEAAPQKIVATENEKHMEVDFDISCMECHQEETPEVYADWEKSAHGKMNFGCYMCHGDGVEDFTAAPKADRCASCHSGNEKCDMHTQDGKCYTCHDSHNLKTEKK
jgi:hypothetical protein